MPLSLSPRLPLNSVALLACLLSALGLSGCLARGGLSGERQALMQAELGKVHQVLVGHIFRTDGLSMEQASLNEKESIVQGRYADETPVTVHTRPATESESSTPGYSMVTIQVGSFGDHERAMDLTRRIQAQLKK